MYMIGFFSRRGATFVTLPQIRQSTLTFNQYTHICTHTYKHTYTHIHSSAQPYAHIHADVQAAIRTHTSTDTCSHTFITWIYMAPLQGYYSEALETRL